MLKAVMIGAGQRGFEVYGVYAEHHPDKLKFVGVAEPLADRNKRFAEVHHIAPEARFKTWQELLAEPKMADMAFICTQDQNHTEVTKMALQKGYHVVLEKPMSTIASECIDMGQYAKKYNRVLNICHVLRYSEFFSQIKKIVASGELGEIINIKHAENVGFWHQAHSFVRGNWNNDKTTSPMVLQKTCHDMDILLWLIGKPCKKLSSFGSLQHFNRSNMPLGAPARCTDGCSHAETCLYDAQRFYLGEQTTWPVSVISVDTSLEARRKALETGPYGRCVYQCDNNVVDHQVTNMEFEGGATATLTMTAFTAESSRSIEIMGTKGHLHAVMNKFGKKASANEIEIIDFRTGHAKTIVAQDKSLMTGHEGADVLMTASFVEQIQRQEMHGLTSAEQSIESHLMSLAAERSRVEQRIVSLDEMWKS